MRIPLRDRMYASILDGAPAASGALLASNTALNALRYKIKQSVSRFHRRRRVPVGRPAFSADFLITVGNPIRRREEAGGQHQYARLALLSHARPAKKR